eukprot:78814-Pyramimonas_sp.AAC.1
MARATSRADKLGRRRDGWTGPGAAVLAEGGAVWVATRARLWKWSAEQLRLASADEEFGVQISQSPQRQGPLRQSATRRAAAVDVQREGSPPEDAWGRA